MPATQTLWHIPSRQLLIRLSGMLWRRKARTSMRPAVLSASFHYGESPLLSKPSYGLFVLYYSFESAQPTTSRHSNPCFMDGSFPIGERERLHATRSMRNSTA